MARITFYAIAWWLVSLPEVDSFHTSSIAPVSRLRSSVAADHILYGTASWNDGANGATASSKGPWTDAASAAAAAAASSSAASIAASSSISSPTAIPFVIERVRDSPSNMEVYTEISKVCIEAFFNDSAELSSSSNIPMWKAGQLFYLRALQAADLERRRRREGQSNIMLVARKVIPASQRSNQPLLLDTRSVYNLPSSSSSSSSSSSESAAQNDDYVRGDLLGFVEITRRFYGLGDDTEMQRPVLTNLAVCRDARRFGVGSALVQACEQAVTTDWQGTELILEVEDDNDRARQFYERLQYQVVGSDPASRRYDTSGLWLRKVRCTRLIMRKDLRTNSLVQTTASVVEDTVTKGLQMLLKIRDTLKR